MTETTAAAVRRVATAARDAAARLATLSGVVRDGALERIAGELERDAAAILAANAADVAAARRATDEGGVSAATLARLVLDEGKLRGMAASVRAVAALDDPVGRVLRETTLDDGLVLQKVVVPLGVFAAIFEARPDAVTQIVALALKSGNAVVLKGGREAERTTRALVACVHRALEGCGIAPDVVGVVEGRAAVPALLRLDDLIDLVVPRGSSALVRMVQEGTRIAVLGHAEGVCHVYVDRHADVGMAVAVVTDSKVQYPAACNAAETVLLDREIAPVVLPALLERFAQEGVEVRGCPETVALAAATPFALSSGAAVVSAGDGDWRQEYGALIIACRIVDGVEGAVAHVHRYGSGHTDAIVTRDLAAAAYFLAHVDSASVFHNASTRFADGYRYGLGAELGISTGKLHARGPVGVEGLTTYKYVLRGGGHVVADYHGPQGKRFAHER